MDYSDSSDLAQEHVVPANGRGATAPIGVRAEESEDYPNINGTPDTTPHPEEINPGNGGDTYQPGKIPDEVPPEPTKQMR